ncbi:MAG: hypothetical protein EU530_08130 [Promethearchaeota archaeon]|nr:MAG: hypothetical protein EU530_08130 [Candidatus Lokiarchaeota archaeon]
MSTLPNINHELTQDDYDTTIRKIGQDLIQLRGILEKKLTMSQQQFLGIHINKIYDAFTYYYNTDTLGPSFSKNNTFKKSSSEIQKFKKKYLSKNKNDRLLVDEILSRLQQLLSKQSEYIKKINQEIKNEKNTKTKN